MANWFNGKNITFTITDYEKIAWPTDSNTIDNYEDDCIEIKSINLYENQDTIYNHDFVGNVLVLNSENLFGKTELNIACIKKEIILDTNNTTKIKFTTLSGEELPINNLNIGGYNLNEIRYTINNTQDDPGIILTDYVFWKVLSDTEEEFCDFTLTKNKDSNYKITFKKSGNYAIPKTIDDIDSTDNIIKDKIKKEYTTSDNLVVSLNGSNKEYNDQFIAKEDGINNLFTLTDFCENWERYYKYTPMDKLLFLKKGFYQFKCYDDNNNEIPGLVKIFNSDSNLNTYDYNNLVSTSDKINLNDYSINRLTDDNWTSQENKQKQIDLEIKTLEEDFDRWQIGDTLPRPYNLDNPENEETLDFILENIYNCYDMDLDELSSVKIRSYENDWNHNFNKSESDSGSSNKPDCPGVYPLTNKFTFTFVKEGVEEDENRIKRFQNNQTIVINNQVIQVFTTFIIDDNVYKFLNISFHTFDNTTLGSVSYDFSSKNEESYKTTIYNAANTLICTWYSNIKISEDTYRYTISLLDQCYVGFTIKSIDKPTVSAKMISLTDIKLNEGLTTIDYNNLHLDITTNYSLRLIAVSGNYKKNGTVTTNIQLRYPNVLSTGEYSPAVGASSIEYISKDVLETNLPSLIVKSITNNQYTVSINIPVDDSLSFVEFDTVPNESLATSYNINRTTSKNSALDYIPSGIYEGSFDGYGSEPQDIISNNGISYYLLIYYEFGELNIILYDGEDFEHIYTIQSDFDSLNKAGEIDAIVKKYNQETKEYEAFAQTTINIGEVNEDKGLFNIEIIDSVEIFDTTNLDTTVQSIILNPTELIIPVGTSKAIDATVQPSWASQTLTWTSSDKTIATVDESGTVEGVSTGKVTITATSTDGSNIKGTCEVSVITEQKNETLQMIDILKYSVKYRISELENEKKQVNHGKYYIKSKIIDENIDPENDWIGEFIFIPNDPYQFVKDNNLTFSIIYLDEIKQFNDIKYYNNKQEYVSCPYVNNYYLGSKEQNLKTFLEKGINLSFSATYESPYFVKGKTVVSNVKTLTPFINTINLPNYNLTTLDDKLMFQYVGGICQQDRSGQNSEIISKLYTFSSQTEYVSLETKTYEANKERNIDISEQEKLEKLSGEYNIPLIPIFLYKTGKDKLAKSTVSANDQSVTVISESNTIDISTNTSLGTIRDKKLYPGSLWGKSIDTWLGRYVGLLSNIYKTGNSSNKVTLIDNYAYYDKYSTTFTKDILVSVSPRSVDNCNKYFTIRDFNYIEWLQELNKYRTGVQNNDSNVNILLEGVIKNFPTSFNFSYEIPTINITQLEDSVSKINTVYGTELTSKITDLDSSKLYTLDKNGNPISIESYPYIPNCENKFTYSGGTVKYNGSMSSEMLDISDLVVNNNLEKGKLTLKDLGKYDVLTTQRKNWRGKKFDEYLTGLPKNNAFIK